MFISAGYGHGAAVFELVKTGDRFQTRTVWENQRMKNKFTSSVLHNGLHLRPRRIDPRERERRDR